MSSGKTQQYGLHLWEPKDPFSRQEFNENFERLDGALLWRRLAEARAEEDTEALSLDVRGLGLTGYAQVGLHIFCPEGKRLLRVRTNGLTEGYSWTDGGTHTRGTGSSLLSISTTGDPIGIGWQLGRPAAGDYVSSFLWDVTCHRDTVFGSFTIYTAPVKWEELESFELVQTYGGGLVPAGTRLALTGMRG